MSELEKYFKIDEKEWLNTLKPYQKNIVTEFLKDTDDYHEAAEKWLTSSPDQTVPFGTKSGKINKEQFKDKLVDEIEKFICGDPKYESERNDLLSQADLTQTAIVSSVSSAIAPVIGTSAPFIIPVVVLVFMVISKISKNAWCEARKENRAKHNQANQADG